MPTRITQIEKAKKETPAVKIIDGDGAQPDCCNAGGIATDAGTVGTVLKVEGTLYLQDAELLEKICLDVGNQTKRSVTLELSELCYLDSDSAAVLCRMKREQGVRLEGLHLFIEKVVELAEECEKAAKYMPKREDPARVT